MITSSIYIFISKIVYFCYWILILSILIRIIMKRRAISSTILWLLIVYFFPLIGIFLYFLFIESQINHLYKKKSRKTWLFVINWFNNLKNVNDVKEVVCSQKSEIANSLFKFCQNKQHEISCIQVQNIQIINNTQKMMKRLIQDIKNSKFNIEMIFYIWFPGGIADEIAKCLIDASNRGVHCRLILDSAGSIKFFKSKWFKNMCQAGIEIVQALKFNLFYIFRRRIDLRQHRKIIIIDNYIAYTGSMNLIDPKIFKKNIGVGEWIDIMVRIKGFFATNLGIIFSYDWAMETGKIILPIPQIPQKTKLNKKKTNEYIQTTLSGPGFHDNIIHQALLTIIYSAKKRLIMTTPYFVPSDDLLRAICVASQRGVEVVLIIPLYNDSILVSWASRAFFDELLESGVKIYQFYGGLLHTKSLIVDDTLSMIGTVNLDMRSLWINFELTLFVDGVSFSRKLFSIYENYISNSILLDSDLWFKRAWKKKVFEKIFYFFSPLL